MALLEKRAVLESAFRFQEPARPLDVVSHLVINMQHYRKSKTWCMAIIKCRISMKNYNAFAAFT